MTRFVITALPALLIALTAIPGGAEAQARCGVREEIVRHLEAKYGETRRSMGVTEGQGVFELFASEETGSWTILVTNPRGTACLVAAGEAWSAEAAKPIDSPA